jgi:outer membrane protein TolC
MRQPIPTALALLVSLGGCTTTSVRSDVAAVNDLLRARDAVPVDVTVPKDDAFAEAGDEIEKLLKQPLTADAAARIALLNNGALKASIVELGVPRGALVQAGLAPNPEVEFAMSRPLEGHHEFDTEVAVEFDLSRLILMPQRKGVASAELQAARQRLAGDVLDTAHRARLALFDVQAAQQLLELRTRALQSFQAAYETAIELHRVGNVTDLDLVTERSAVEAARVAVATAETQVVDARERLNVVLGMSGAQTTWTVAGTLPAPPAEEVQAATLEQRAVENSLELAELKARLDATAGRADLASAGGWLSHLAVGAHAEREEQVWEVGGHVSVGIPLFDRGQGEVASAEAQLRGLQHRYVQTATEARAAARTVYSRTETARRSAIHLRDVLLPSRQRALEETLRNYNAMQIGVFQLLQAQRDTLDAGVSYVETLHDYWRARAALDLVLAGRHTGLGLGEVRSGASMPAASSGGGGDAH